MIDDTLNANSGNMCYLCGSEIQKNQLSRPEFSLKAVSMHPKVEDEEVGD